VTWYCPLLSYPIDFFLSSIIIISHSSYFRCSFSLFPN
jgi:hypothetical protein